MSALRIGTREGLFDIASGERRISIEKRRITHLARHGVSWWAVADRSEILSEEAPGVPWRSVGTLRGAEITSLFPSPWGLLVGTSRAGLFRLHRGALEPVQGMEQANGREKWRGPNGDIQTRSLSMGPGGILYVNVHVGGILRSDDKGASFEPTALDLEADAHQVVAHPEIQGLVFAATALGLCMSRDAGATWKRIVDGLHATYQRALAIAGDMIVVSASTGPGGGRAALYRTPVYAPGNFERCREGLPPWFSGNINTGCLAARGSEIVAGDPGGTVYVSGNGGMIWRAMEIALPPIHCLAIV
jgi:hypothetical protein